MNIVTDLPDRRKVSGAMNTNRLPRVLNQKSAKALLEREGWTETIGGKHVVKIEKPGQRPITLPQNHGRDYPPGLRSAILREAGLKGGEQNEQ